MKNLTRFLRSVIPADPWQLVFLAGAVFLFISPRFSWRPSDEILMSNAHFGLYSDALTKSMSLVVVLLCPTIFCGLVAYFTCFYPGRKPVRRILWAVVVPALFSLIGILLVFYQMSRTPTSILHPRTLNSFLQWLRANIANFPVGLELLAFSILFVTIFLVRLRLGSASLPLALPGQLHPSVAPSDSWPRIQVLIFVLVCPLFLLSGFIGLLLALPYLIFHQSMAFGYGAYAIFTKIIGPPLDAAILIGLVLLILGHSGKADARNSVELPEPRYALYALLLPIGITCLLSFSGYLIDRANWAIYFIDQSFPPQFASHFNLTRAWDPWLLLMIFGAFAEEIVFRGVLLQRLMIRYGFHRGVFLTGLEWGAYHFRFDTYSGPSVGGVFFHLADRILICLAMNYVLGLMTLRWRSIIPAGIAHTVSNILVVA